MIATYTGRNTVAMGGLEEEIEHRIRAVVIACVQPYYKAGVAVDEAMNDYAPTNKTCSFGVPKSAPNICTE